MKPAFSGADQPSGALIDACVHCGFCLPSCPTYVLWQEEMDSPRGRVYLMKAGLDARAEMTPTFVKAWLTVCAKVPLLARKLASPE